MTKASEQRIETFIDEFIRSEYMQNWTSEKDSDFINEPDRAERCYAAAEFGADGKTHAEVIEDWREAFDNFWKYDRKGGRSELDRFVAGVHAHFDRVEAFHEQAGTLYQEIG